MLSSLNPEADFGAAAAKVYFVRDLSVAPKFFAAKFTNGWFSCGAAASLRSQVQRI